MIPFNGEYTRHQWGRGIRLAMLPTGLSLALRWLALALALGSVALVVASLVEGELSVWRLLRPAISGAILGAWGMQPYVRAWRASAQPWRKGAATPRLRGLVTAEGVVSDASASGEAEPWDRFVRAHVREDMVVLLGVDGLATLLPRDFFGSEEEWQSFRQLVALYVVPPA